MIKYRTFFGDIEVLEVESETACQVVAARPLGQKGYKESKRSNLTNWHDTWEEARDFLLSEAQIEADDLRVRLERAKGKIDNIKGLKPPTGAGQ